MVFGVQEYYFYNHYYLYDCYVHISWIIDNRESCETSKQVHIILLKGVNWNMGNSTNTVENEFVNGFADLGLMQCIDAPTHNKGKTLDILLTKSKQYITDLKIIDTERYCISD